MIKTTHKARPPRGSQAATAALQQSQPERSCTATARSLAAIRDQVRIGIRLVRSLSARPFANRMAEVCREHAQIEEAINAATPRRRVRR
jgi:hypothetical protein